MLIYRCNCKDVEPVEYDLKYDDWVHEFKPIANPATNEEYLIDYISLNGFKRLKHMLKNDAGDSHIWTCFDDWSIASGYWMVNRLDYIITEVPHNRLIHVLDPDFKDHECETYHNKKEK